MIHSVTHVRLHVQEDLYSWMTDRLARDQFVIKAGEETLIGWNDGKRSRAEEVRGLG